MCVLCVGQRTCIFPSASFPYQISYMNARSRRLFTENDSTRLISRKSHEYNFIISFVYFVYFIYFFEVNLKHNRTRTHTHTHAPRVPSHRRRCGPSKSSVKDFSTSLSVAKIWRHTMAGRLYLCLVGSDVNGNSLKPEHNAESGSSGGRIQCSRRCHVQAGLQR